MKSPQWKSGFVVVEVRHAFDLCPGLLTVALSTILSKFVVVDIFVTTGTIGMRHVSEMLERLSIDGFFFVAIDASYFCVLSFQRKIGLIVMEVRNRFETLEIVTFGAVI